MNYGFGTDLRGKRGGWGYCLVWIGIGSYFLDSGLFLRKVKSSSVIISAA